MLLEIAGVVKLQEAEEHAVDPAAGGDGVQAADHHLKLCSGREGARCGGWGLDNATHRIDGDVCRHHDARR